MHKLATIERSMHNLSPTSFFLNQLKRMNLIFTQSSDGTEFTENMAFTYLKGLY